MAPYIGITGFMSQSEVKQALKAVPFDSSHRLMVGVLASSKTLAGKTNKYPGRYPPIGTISSIFIDGKQLLNLIHYATDDPSTLDNQLFRLWYLGGDCLDGFQLNIVWPNPRLLEQARKRGAEIILQISRRAMAAVDGNIQTLASKLDDYDGLIAGILLDPSGGSGTAFDPVQAYACLKAIHERHPGLELGVAGGLSAHSIHLVQPLILGFPDLSIDAENRLRDPIDDHLDVDTAYNYLTEAFKLFKRG